MNQEKVVYIDMDDVPCGFSGAYKVSKETNPTIVFLFYHRRWTGTLFMGYMFESTGGYQVALLVMTVINATTAGSTFLLRQFRF